MKVYINAPIECVACGQTLYPDQNNILKGDNDDCNCGNPGFARPTILLGVAHMDESGEVNSNPVVLKEISEDENPVSTESTSTDIETDE